METHIAPVEPSGDSLIAGIYEPADYRDAFLLPGSGWGTVEEVAQAYFLNQPRWLSLMSMNLGGRDKLIRAIGDADFVEGSAIGLWKVHLRSDDEIVFGDDMGFMQYRFSLRLHTTGDVEASTAVKYQWPRSSRFYFAIVKPLHRRFVPMSLRAIEQPAPAARANVST